jgi:predicted regulator of Ras-like GTPase activity (Roadblock/LC7/MglB family)
MNSAMHAAVPPGLLLVSRYADLLARLRRDTAGVVSASLATADGLAVASTLADEEDIDRLAAMSGSIAALASALTRETGHGEPERVVLESETGVIVSLKVAGQQGGMVLTVVTDRDAVLGKLLWDCRATALEIVACHAQLAG